MNLLCLTIAFTAFCGYVARKLMNILSGKRFFPALAVFAVAGTILALNVPSVNSIFKNAAYSAMHPVQSNLWKTSADIHNFFALIGKTGSLESENRHLKEEIGNARAQIAAAENIKKENEFLRQALNLELEKEFDLKLATIAGKMAGNDILLIDKGEDDMIRTGMAVIGAKKELVGKVAKTYRNFSEIALITGEGFSFDVKIAGEADGLLKGLGNGKAIVDLISKDILIEKNNEIIVGALGGIFPEGLLVGTIESVRDSDTGTFQSADIAPAFDIAGLKRVFVAVGKNPLPIEAGTALLDSSQP